MTEVKRNADQKPTPLVTIAQTGTAGGSPAAIAAGDPAFRRAIGQVASPGVLARRPKG